MQSGVAGVSPGVSRVAPAVRQSPPPIVVLHPGGPHTCRLVMIVCFGSVVLHSFFDVSELHLHGTRDLHIPPSHCLPAAQDVSVGSPSSLHRGVSSLLHSPAAQCEGPHTCSILACVLVVLSSLQVSCVSVVVVSVHPQRGAKQLPFLHSLMGWRQSDDAPSFIHSFVPFDTVVLSCFVQVPIQSVCPDGGEHSLSF